MNQTLQVGYSIRLGDSANLVFERAKLMDANFGEIAKFVELEIEQGIMPTKLVLEYDNLHGQEFSYEVAAHLIRFMALVIQVCSEFPVKPIFPTISSYQVGIERRGLYYKSLDGTVVPYQRLPHSHK